MPDTATETATETATDEAPNATANLTAPAAPSAAVLTALLAGAALSGFDAGAVGFVLPALRQATGAGPQAASWLVSGYVAAMLLAVPLAGAAAARWGALPLFRAGAALAALGALLALATTSVAVVLAARALQGMGQGPLLPLAATLVAQRWPAAHQGRLVGLLSLAYGTAFLAATVLAPTLLRWGWQATFWLALATALATLAASLRRERALAIGRRAQPPAPGPDAAWAAPWRALLGRQMLAIAVLALGTGVGQALLVWFPTLAIARLGVPVGDTALLMLPLVVGGIAATVAITAVLDRVGARRLLAMGAISSVAGVLLAVAAPPTPAAFMAGAGLFGLGVVGLCGGPLRYAAARAVPGAAQGPAQSAVSLLTNVGLLAGSLLLGALAAASAGERTGVEAALLAGSALMGASFVALLALAPHHPER